MKLRCTPDVQINQTISPRSGDPEQGGRKAESSPILVILLPTSWRTLVLLHWPGSKGIPVLSELGSSALLLIQHHRNHLLLFLFLPEWAIVGANFLQPQNADWYTGGFLFFLSALVFSLQILFHKLWCMEQSEGSMLEGSPGYQLETHGCTQVPPYGDTL